MPVIYTEIQQSELEQLTRHLELLKECVHMKQDQLNLWLADPKNNVYASIEDATELEDTLSDEAHQDCEGSYNCGNSEYSREFIVGGKLYIAKLENIQYNRHDKTYYYIEGYDFNIYPL